MGWDVVAYVGGQRFVFYSCSNVVLANLLRLRCYGRDFVTALGLLLRTGVESVPLRFVVERSPG